MHQALCITARPDPLQCALSVDMDSKLSLLSSDMDGKLGKLYVMFGVIMAGLAIPIIQTLITWLA